MRGKIAYRNPTNSFMKPANCLDAGTRQKFPLKNYADGWSGHEKRFAVKRVVPVLEKSFINLDGAPRPPSRPATNGGRGSTVLLIFFERDYRRHADLATEKIFSPPLAFSRAILALTGGTQ
jgi:hypothetical protein